MYEILHIYYIYTVIIQWNGKDRNMVYIKKEGQEGQEGQKI